MNLREWARITHRVLSEQREEGGAALSGDLVELILRAAINTLIDALVDGGDLRIDALGRLWSEEKAPRRVVSNLAGKRRVYGVRARRMVRFRASRGLVAQLNSRYEHVALRDTKGNPVDEVRPVVPDPAGVDYVDAGRA